MRQFTQREQRILTLSIIAVFTYLLYNTLYKPWRQTIDGYNQEKGKDRRILAKDLKLILQAEGIKDVYEKYSNLFQQKGSDEEQMSTFISQLEDIAAEMRLRFSEIKPSKVKRSQFCNVFSVRLAMEGNSSKIAEFLYKLQTQPQLFNVEEIRLEKNLPQDNLLQASLVISRKLIFKK